MPARQVLHCAAHGFVGKRWGRCRPPLQSGSWGSWREQAGYVAAGGIYFNGNRDGVAVVLDDEDDGKLEVGGAADCLPELALAGGAFTERNVDDLVSVEGDVVESAIVGGSGGLLCGLGTPGEVTAGFSATDGVQALGGGGGRRRDDVELLAGPVGGHLAAAAGGVSPPRLRPGETALPEYCPG